MRLARVSISGRSPARVAWQQWRVPPSVQTGGSGAATARERKRERVVTRTGSVVEGSMLAGSASSVWCQESGEDGLGVYVTESRECEREKETAQAPCLKFISIGACKGGDKIIC